MPDSIAQDTVRSFGVRAAVPAAVPAYLTTAEVADLARTSPETVRWWRHAGGRGPRSFKLGRRVLYAREDVETWIAEARAAEGSTR